MKKKSNLDKFIKSYIKWSKKMTTPTAEDLDKMEQEYLNRQKELTKQSN